MLPTRYRLVAEQIIHAEKLGFDSAWVAQHHFDANEGGLPAPLIFLAELAARTSRIRLGTGVITLPMEAAVRVAEDTAVLDILSNSRLEIGFGTGGTPQAFLPFGLESADRGTVYAKSLATVRVVGRTGACRWQPALSGSTTSAGSYLAGNLFRRWRRTRRTRW